MAHYQTSSEWTDRYPIFRLSFAAIINKIAPVSFDILSLIGQTCLSEVFWNHHHSNTLLLVGKWEYLMEEQALESSYFTGNAAVSVFFDFSYNRFLSFLRFTYNKLSSNYKTTINRIKMLYLGLKCCSRKKYHRHSRIRFCVFMHTSKSQCRTFPDHSLPTNNLHRIAKVFLLIC